MHTCHATGCTNEVPPVMFMCRDHWYKLPKGLRDEIWRTYRPGQCDDWNITSEYANAARAGVRYLALKEGLEPDTRIYDMLDPSSSDQKLSIYDFGKELLRIKDLDPVYILIHEAQLAPRILRRWLLAYWCFYHVGTASWITQYGEESDNFYWYAMLEAAGSKKYPRCPERRHFRGDNAKNSVKYLSERGIDDLFAPLEEGPYKVSQVIESVKEWVGFGPWISFKVADMLECLGLCEIQFDSETAIYGGSPTEGVNRFFSQYEDSAETRQDERTQWALVKLAEGLNVNGSLPKAPPRYERSIGVQEAETMFCKWNSYMKGHYKLGEDIEAVREGLLRFSKCRLSQRLLKAGSKGGLW